jgi:hypothetical protein
LSPDVAWPERIGGKAGYDRAAESGSSRQRIAPSLAQAQTRRARQFAHLLAEPRIS